jgi:DNA-binding FadR family transcriptional regulator
MLKPVEKQRVAEEIVEQLRSLILTGQYAPGAKLPPERELAKKLGVNRASLREALKKLEHLGLVRIRQGDGTRVTNYMETAGIELVSHLVAASSSDPEIIGDVLEFRRVIGREVARLAATRVEEEDLSKLRELAERANDPDLPADQVFQLDFEFYVALTSATKNKVMGLLVNTVRDAVASYLPVLAHLTVSPETVREHHRDLLAALEKGDADAAANAADAYLNTGAEHIIGMLSDGQIQNPATKE